MRDVSSVIATVAVDEVTPASKADNRAYLKLRDKAYRLLARREQSAWELRRKLSASYYGENFPEVVTKVLSELAADNAQSDARFAEQHCRRRYNTGRGPVKLKYELTQHQIGEELMTRVMLQYEDKWAKLAQEVRQRKFGDAKPADYKSWAKQARFLQQRGFTSEQIGAFDR